MSKRIQGFGVIGLIAAVVFAIGGCASSGGGEAANEKTPAAKEAAKPAVPVPADSKLAKIDIGMTDLDVRKAIGEPDAIRMYPTGKNWIPFYFGGDTMRADWSYYKVGKGVLSNTCRWTRSMKVVELRPDSNEP
jgi:hypothetical protein